MGEENIDTIEKNRGQIREPTLRKVCVNLLGVVLVLASVVAVMVWLNSVIDRIWNK